MENAEYSLKQRILLTETKKSNTIQTDKQIMFLAGNKKLKTGEPGKF